MSDCRFFYNEWRNRQKWVDFLIAIGNESDPMVLEYRDFKQAWKHARDEFLESLGL